MGDTVTMSFINSHGEEIPGYRYKNPDGTTGGWVAESATIENGAYIEACSIVGPGAVIGTGLIVRAFMEVAEDEIFVQRGY